MFKLVPSIVFLFLFFIGQAQEASLPADLRQHTLNQYNASLFNPAFSLNRNNPESISFWTRWQWQTLDADPTTLFLNYTRGLNENSAAGIGFFQHNTGIYFNTGAVVNYAYEIEFNRLIKISFGANVLGFLQQIADTRFVMNPIPGIPQSTPTDDFILQVAPGFNVQVENFSMSLASENLIDFNFTDKGANTDKADKIFMGMASYDFPIMASDTTAYVRPSIYLRTIPEQPNQIGLNALFSTRKFWVQSGYNNFYGISIGGGGTFFERLSLGAMLEFGNSASLNSKDPSFEVIASYYLGKKEERRPLVASGVLNEVKQVVVLSDELTNEQMRQELEKAQKLANQEEEKIEEVEEPITPKIIEEEKIAEEEKVTEEELDPVSEINVDEETQESKKEARKLVAEQKAIEKQNRKDLIAEAKKEKEALALSKKQEEDQAEAEAEEIRKASEELAEANKLEEQKRKEALKNAKDVGASAEMQRKELQRKELQRKLDSIDDARKSIAVKAAEELEKKQEQDAIDKAKEQNSIDEVKEQEAIDEAKELAAKKEAENAVVIEETNEISEPEVVELEAGEKYEEVATEDGLEPGYYLIANVFGTKKYFDAFMENLTNKGIQPKSFFRSANKYNYAYLERYNTIREARQARDSKFNGKYTGKTWIFRVVGK